ncbi:hypothetical protein N7466_000445 [Penicillium verhagenii]|uniref:uncharacterized protein n=1 Tax=Penicillium verhagenii TaxID=1562060 RepID=UPI002544DBF2|nr:uncharacterized protein N7466_000445 [Penicillium verhagenii]KAJ5947430.1 hypothetical protein N7466_000445 [Penicillium verhagenii]
MSTIHNIAAVMTSADESHVLQQVAPSTDNSSGQLTPAHSGITSECSSDNGMHAGNGTGNDFLNQSPRTNTTQVPIAVVGMACRLPGHSNSPKALWDFLERGGIAENRPPASRFNLDAHFDKHRRPRTMKSPGGMFMEDVDPEVFDGGFFNMSPVDCTAMDPQQRQLLEVTYECLENAGITLEMIGEQAIGCLVGANAVDYEAIQARDPEDRPDSATIGVARAILSNRISHFLNIRGPSMTIDTACSGSLVSLDVACRYLDTNQADGMIVSGANMWLNPEHNQETGMMRATQSASGKCHTFDAKADGYVKAEAINAVFLKRLSDAIRDGDPIRAVIRGTSTNSAGRTPGIASPSSEAQAAAIRAAYANAGISNFLDTGYLECHGTGTLAGDPVEVAGAASVFAKGRGPGQELVIGSIKSNIGHSEAAAGISGLIKAILAVERGMIPGNPTFVKPNPNIDFDALRVRATRHMIKWPVGTQRRASVNSFGFGGANAHVVLESAENSPHVSSYLERVGLDFFNEEEDASPEQSSEPKLLVFSANDEPSLKNNIQAISAHLMSPGVRFDMGDLSYTLSERRTRHYQRAFLVTRGKEIPQERIIFGKNKGTPPKIGFLFTGQGAQWSQMGLEVLNTFPVARNMIHHLDDVLQTSLSPPEWTLWDELTKPRSGDALRQPEFSQPLVTALQLLILEVMKSWGIVPTSVVGHSSGEIAAAAAAGLITPEAAIKIAYYRGHAAKKVSEEVPLGMLAVGIGAEEVGGYLDRGDGTVQIACYNSPSSLTLSGPASALEMIRDHLQEDGHFARMLLVNLAYHSKYMTQIGEEYEALLLKDEDLRQDNVTVTQETNEEAVRMFSSVTGQLMITRPDAAYWKANMISPVRFAQATTELLQSESASNFLVEIGPSNALAGPVTQIKKSLSGAAADAQYTTALKRGADSIVALYEVAGSLFVSGGSVSLKQVNHHNAPRAPRVIVDLPNYSWNHSTKYWHETTASTDWRFKQFISHDLLGSKILGTAWSAPVFKKTLKLADVSWLVDHKLGSQVVFPGAGYISMAVEAMYQTAWMTSWKGEPPARYRYRLRDVKLVRALVLEPDVTSRIILALTPVPGSTRSWFEFKVSSLREATWVEHCVGLVRIDTEYSDQRAPEGAVDTLKFASSARSWYKVMADVGYNFGPAFQKHLQVEAITGQRRSRSTVSLQPPESSYGQSIYPMHPACIDGCFQTVSPALWGGDRTTVGAVLVPAVISSLVITAQEQSPSEAISVASAHYLGIGRNDTPRNYGTDCSVYNPQDGSLLLEMKGLQFRELETSEDERPQHVFTRSCWNADISTLLSAPTATLQQVLEKNMPEAQSEFNPVDSEGSGPTRQQRLVQTLVDLVAYKCPKLKILEVKAGPEDATSIWLQSNSLPSNSIRDACSLYHFASTDSTALVAAQNQYSSRAPNAEFTMISPTVTTEILDGVKFDLAIVAISQSASTEEARAVVASVYSSMHNNSLVLVIGQETFSPTVDIQAVLSETNFGNIHTLGDKVYLCSLVSGEQQEDWNNIPERGIIKQVSLLPTAQEAHSQIIESLRNENWNVDIVTDVASNITANETVLILDELSTTVMDCLDERQWEILQHLIQKECQILWVTSGAQINVTDPTKAAISGFFRVLRAEEPLLRLVVLDVEQPSEPPTVTAIEACLTLMAEPQAKESIESEFVERGGVLHVNRILPDATLTGLQDEDPSARKTETLDLHASNTRIRLSAERLGNIDSVHYWEQPAADSLALPDGFVEVEIFAAGMNYKDVVVTMGIVPGNEHTLGGEGAGLITRVSPGVTSFAVGQRVVVFDKGTFANRVQTTPGRVHSIPDWMTFEQASTLSAVYLTSIYSLFDLGNVVKDQRVLIHSAAGGVGIAAIQLCQYAGAEIFATVGTDEKREFLKSTFGLSDDRIFNSRNTDFANQISNVTNGQGVDLILNSLTGDMLDESWRILADGGTMIEIGKKDILDRNGLSMEPFDRNISFRAVDMSHERAPDHLVSRLMSRLFELIEAGHLKPIAPIHQFSFAEIPSAIRFLRAGKHIGKIVISDGPEAVVKVPVRRTPKALTLRNDACYLIVGGLKGLCASLAVYLAKCGAKYLAVISRSGHTDEKSQGVVREIQALGCQIDLLSADVSVMSDVEKAFSQTAVPIGGIVQGAMVLRDRTFSSMSVDEYHGALSCKIQGTWNLHHAAENLGLQLDFFTMLSSISGVVGQKGQANYAAGNAFLDSFASYRRRLGRPACAVDLGVIEDVGYIHERDGMQQKLDTSIWVGINEGLLRRILYFSILQQQPDALSILSNTQVITGIPVPQPENSQLLHDARFAGLFTTSGRTAADGGEGGSGGSKDVQALLLLLRSKSPDHAAQLAATVEVVNKCFVRVLRLSEPIDTGRPLSVYGIDSLAAVEVRNWLRAELGALVTTLDILNASSLIALCEKVVAKATSS